MSAGRTIPQVRASRCDHRAPPPERQPGDGCMPYNRGPFSPSQPSSTRFNMAQFIYTMNRVGKVVPPKRVILRDISLSFFPGAKIGVLGLNGSGKSTLLRIMAGIDKEFEGEARPQPGINIGFLPQEPQLDPTKDVRGNVEIAVKHIKDALTGLDAV